jgi:hypothetical protein
MYTPGQDNPFPDQIPATGPLSWSSMTQFFQMQHAIGYTLNHPMGQRPGGTMFFSQAFADLAPGFAINPTDYTQMTGFFHEHEHAANQNPNYDTAIDLNYEFNAQIINTDCKPLQVETESVPITGQLQ